MKVCCYSWFPRSAVGTHTARGFTLLEMLLVIFLMALVASTGLLLTEGVETQAKYDDTKRRLEMIRIAIVGDPTRTVNGGPEISGFVADMGRLPLCLAELLELGDEVLPATSPRTFASPCDDTVTISEWTLNADTGIGLGWRGPYLQVLPESSGNLRFRDGYSNEGVSAAADALNSGWSWRLYKADETEPANVGEAAILRLQSNGFDGSQPYPAGDMDDALPANRPAPLVVSNDWRVQLPAAVSVTFVNQSGSKFPAADTNLLLRIYLSDLTDDVESDEGSPDYLVLANQAVLENSRKSENFNLDAPPSLPTGMRGYAVVCYENPPADPDDYVIFDGDCETGGSNPNPKPDFSNIRSFVVVPRQTLNLYLDWIIP